MRTSTMTPNKLRSHSQVDNASALFAAAQHLPHKIAEAVTLIVLVAATFAVVLLPHHCEKDGNALRRTAETMAAAEAVVPALPPPICAAWRSSTSHRGGFQHFARSCPVCSRPGSGSGLRQPVRSIQFRTRSGRSCHNFLTANNLARAAGTPRVLAHLGNKRKRPWPP